MTTLYRKVMRGKRVSYEPAEEVICWDAMPDGAHLLIVKPGSRSARYRIDPAYADVIAAVMLHREDILQAVRQASEAKPAHRLTRRELAAFEAYKEATGRDSLMMSRASASELLDAVIDAIKARA